MPNLLNDSGDGEICPYLTRQIFSNFYLVKMQIRENNFQLFLSRSPLLLAFRFSWVTFYFAPSSIWCLLSPSRHAHTFADLLPGLGYHSEPVSSARRLPKPQRPRKTQEGNNPAQLLVLPKLSHIQHDAASCDESPWDFPVGKVTGLFIRPIFL